MGRELLAVIEQIGREKGIDAGRILDAVESALLTAAKKKYGAAENIQVRIDRKSGEVEAISLKKIVNEVTNPKSEVSLEEARKVDSEAELGDEIGSVIEIEDFGRIAAQTAKQVIFQKVREAEWEVVQREYSARQGDLVNGIILGQERRNYIVDLGKTEAILPAHEQIPRETYRRGDRIKAYLLEVKRTQRDVQVILSRTHPNFIVKLFESEVPEIAEKIVEIKGVVREPGDRTKIAVASRDRAVDPVGACVGMKGSRVQAVVPEIAEKIVEIKGVVREPGDRTKIAVASRDRAVDPVGACVGMKGSRVQAVVRELRGEKIDIIAWTQDSRVFIAEALNPAVIEKVGLDEEKKSALVVVADNQLSLAIGRNGQNVRLAAKLTGWKIDIIGASEYEKERVVRDQETRAAIAQQLQEQHARLVQAESAAAAAQQASAEEAEPQTTPAAGATDSEAATG